MQLGLAGQSDWIVSAPRRSAIVRWTYLAKVRRSEQEANGRWYANPPSHFKTRRLNHMHEAKATAIAVVWVENSSPRHFFREFQISTQ
jgi:hypothetical protein